VLKILNIMNKSESSIQQEIFVWFKNNYCLKNHKPKFRIFAVPNQGKNAKEQAYKKMIGMESGVSDLIICLPKKVIFVELKTDKGVQSDAQKDFQKDIEDLGLEYYLIRNLEHFQQLIFNKLENI
jgi:hypothetical protein